jgi:hypothetical protein
MPRVDFNELPATARVWVFGAAAPLDAAALAVLLPAVDAHLAGWRAHGVPLVCARELRDERFLAVGVDEAATGASGCSIDGLFRTLVSLESALGTSLVGGGRVHWRDASGAVRSGSRAEFRALAADGTIGPETRVFDTTVATVGDWRSAFERPAGASWHAQLLGERPVQGAG